MVLPCGYHVYLDTYLDVSIVLSEHKPNFTLEEAQRVVVRFTYSRDSSTVIEYDSQNGDIDLQPNRWIVHIEPGDITKEGKWQITAYMVDALAKKRGLVVYPDSIIFNPI